MNAALEGEPVVQFTGPDFSYYEIGTPRLSRT